jgi:hypothetical protein
MRHDREEVIVYGRFLPFDGAGPAAMAAHVRTWADRALHTGDVDWRRWESAALTSYGYCGLRRPAPVVRTTSPLALARALELAGIDEVPGDEDRAVVGVLRQALQERVERAVRRRIDPRSAVLVRRGVFEPLDAALPGPAIARAVDEALRQAPGRDPAGVKEAAFVASRGIRDATRERRRGRFSGPVVDKQSWTLHLGGQWEAAWLAYTSFLAGLYGAHEQPRGWRRRLDTLIDAQSAGWWWPHLDFVAVSERPVLVHTDTTGDAPGRLHCATGPAIEWSDGWSLYFWHGTRVPAWVVQGPSIPAIHAESNVEVRRCAIEAMGWDAYIAAARLSLVDTAVDPGNPDHEIRLYDVPESVWGAPARVLLATNGSAERDGTRRRYGLPVPGDLTDAVQAAAWTYGLTGDQYARLARRT